MSTRVRQFNSTRGKNLSQSFSQVDALSRSSAFNQTKLMQSQSSAFLKKEKKPVCVNCVNRKMTKERKEKQIDMKQKEQARVKEKGLIDQEQLSNMQRQRAKMTREVERYNKRVAQRQLNSVQSDKNLDLVFVRQIQKREKQLRQIDEQVHKIQKERQIQYRKGLEKQLKQQKARQNEEKREKLKTKPQQSIIKKEANNSYLEKYRKDLQRQVNQDKLRKQQEKKLQKQLNSQQLQTAELNFQKYSEYSHSKKYQYNPEIFQDMKQKEIQSKKEKQQLRVMKQRQRQQQMRKSKEQYQKSVKKQLQKMKSYANELAHQVSQKKISQERSKKEDTRESRAYLYAEQLVQSRKRQCGQCHHPVKESYLTFVD